MSKTEIIIGRLGTNHMQARTPLCVLSILHPHSTFSFQPQQVNQVIVPKVIDIKLHLCSDHSNGGNDLIFGLDLDLKLSELSEPL